MELGLHMRYSGAQAALNMDMVQEAESLGFHSVWTSEAYGSDAVSTISWIGAHTKQLKLGTAIMQMPGRSPAMTAMTAMTLDHLSDGRFILGIGASGPQVVEGWHDVPYGKPPTRTREHVEPVLSWNGSPRASRFDRLSFRCRFRRDRSAGASMQPSAPTRRNEKP